MDKVNVGVVGIGHLGSLHARVYAHLKSANLIGVCDVDKRCARKIGRKYKIWYYSDYQELFDKIQAVSIAVPTSLHYKIAKDFLKAGIHVLVEKPITKTLEEADELIQIADKKNLILQVGHVERFNPAVLAIEPYLKTPRFIEGQRMGPLSKKSRVKDVGVVLDLMIHDIDIILGFLKSDVKNIEVVGTSSVSDFEDMVNVRISFKNDTVCDITASRVTQEEIRKIRIFQEDSYILLDLLYHDAYIFRKKGGRIVRDRLMIKRREPLKVELKSFINSIQTSSRPVVSGREGRKALSVALAILDKIK
jgi:predicted dehydrogenase